MSTAKSAVIYGDFQQALDNQCKNLQYSNVGREINLKKFESYLDSIDEILSSKQLEICKNYAYLKKEKYDNEEEIIELLSSHNYEIKFGPFPKKDIDTTICTDLLLESIFSQVVILCSGDGDFYPPIEKLIKMGKEIYIISTEKAINPVFRNIVPNNHFILLHDCPKCEGQGRHNNSSGEYTVKCLDCKGTGLLEFIFTDEDPE